MTNDKAPTLAPPKPEDTKVSVQSMVDGARSGLSEAGDIAVFSVKTVRELPTLRL